MQKEFEQAIKNNQGRIRYIASRYCKDGEFEDLYQEILMQLWRSFASFNGESAQATWIYKVALNTACTFVRLSQKDNKIKRLALGNVIKDSIPAQDYCQAEILNSFMNLLNDMDANILMMYLDGFTSNKCADVIGISANAIRSRIKRIKSEFEQFYIGE